MENLEYLLDNLVNAAETGIGVADCRQAIMSLFDEVTAEAENEASYARHQASLAMERCASEVRKARDDAAYAEEEARRVKSAERRSKEDAEWARIIGRRY